MAQDKFLISTHFPYLPIKVILKRTDYNLEALLDTGFNGEVALPPNFVTNGQLPYWYVDCKLANELVVKIPAIECSVKFGNRKFSKVTLLIMGDESVIGRGLSNYFKVTLDHGQKVIVEP